MNVWRSLLPLAATIFGLWALSDRNAYDVAGNLSFLGAEPTLEQQLQSASLGKVVPGDLLRSLVDFLLKACQLFLRGKDVDRSDPYPYWRFIPTLVGHIPPDSDGVAATAVGSCFDLKLSSEFRQRIFPSIFGHRGHYLRLHVEATQKPTPAGTKCWDEYAAHVLGLPHFFSVKHSGKQLVDLDVHSDDASIWNAKTRGVRVYHMPGSLEGNVWALLETVKLFEPLIGGAEVKKQGAEKNLDFLRKYANFDMPPRNGTLNVDIPEEIVKDGDFLGLIRLDGLDPTLSWAMGSTTGHTAVALRFDGKLHVVESTAKGNYWPTNGMQKTEWKQWLQQYRKADYHIVHLPLSDEKAKQFDADAARKAFIYEYEGFDYGYANMLWSWVDTVNGNYPCMPAGSTRQACLTWDLVEVIVSLADSLSHKAAQLLFLPGLARRVDLPPSSSWPQILEAAYHKFDGDVAQLPLAPEQDDWRYPTTLNGKPATGPARMCDALVCSIWKAGGLFGDLSDQIQCTEFTNQDAWGLKFFDPDPKSKRPAVCVEADPDNELCQLSGKYSMKLRTPMYYFNQYEPHAHMAEKCPSLAPDYIKPKDC